MAAFTSKATGNWNSGGQTTWNQVGVPGTGDTVTINSPHTVTVTVSTAVGDGSSTAITVASGATLAINAGVILTVYGPIDQAGVIDIGAGGAIDFEPFPTTPSTVNITIASFTTQSPKIACVYYRMS